MRYPVDKLHKGAAEVREYNAQQCIKKKESMTIVYDGDTMTLTSEELETKRISISPPFPSQYGKPYRLYGYVWQPKKIEL